MATCDKSETDDYLNDQNDSESYPEALGAFLIVYVTVRAWVDWIPVTASPRLL